MYCGQEGPKVVESIISSELPNSRGGAHRRGPTGGYNVVNAEKLKGEAKRALEHKVCI
jgi:hypothetical protein